MGISSRYEPSQEGGRELVLRVVPDSPAERAGLAEGDWVLGYNGKPHTALSLSALIDSTGWVEPGKPLRLDVLRQGQQLALTIVPEPASPGQQAALWRFLDECRGKPGGCNELCSGAEPEPEISLRQITSEHGEVVLTFTKDPVTGEPLLLKSEPALPKSWEFRRDPVFSSDDVLGSMRSLLKSRSELIAVYRLKEPGRFSLAFKI